MSLRVPSVGERADVDDGRSDSGSSGLRVVLREQETPTTLALFGNLLLS